MSTLGLLNGGCVCQENSRMEKSTESTLPSRLKSVLKEGGVGSSPPPPPRFTSKMSDKGKNIYVNNASRFRKE